MIHHALIKQVQQDFHMQRKDRAPHPCAVLPPHIQILAEKQKLQYTAPYKQECTNPFHSSHARIRDQRDSCHKKAAMHFVSLERTTQPLDQTWCKGSGRQRTKRQLCSVILCFQAYCALTARKSSAKPQNSPQSATWPGKLAKMKSKNRFSLCVVSKGGRPRRRQAC